MMNITELSTRGEGRGDKAFSGTDPNKAYLTHVEVLIHTNGALDESAVQHMIHKLNQVEGVGEIRFTPAKDHLVMVSYDSRAVKAARLLAAVRELGHNAQLVGL